MWDPVCVCPSEANWGSGPQSPTRSRCTEGLLVRRSRFQSHRSPPDGWPHTSAPRGRKESFLFFLPYSSCVLKWREQPCWWRTCSLRGPMFLTGGGWQGRSTTKMWLLREAELTRLDTVTSTLNSPVLMRETQAQVHITVVSEGFITDGLRNE